MSKLKKLLAVSARMRPDRDIEVKKGRIGRVPVLILKPADKHPEDTLSPALLWIHGGGYFLGMKEMVYMSRAADLVRKYGITVVSPGYRLAFQKPYPAALKDCYHTLLFMNRHAAALGIDREAIMVGGESAGGGIAAALCMLARDRKTVKIFWQFPLYPMLDNLDTVSSRNNHGRIWNTKRNHLGWKIYLREMAEEKVSPYAAPARQKVYHDLPPAYTFVGDGEPFYAETLEYIRRLKEAGVDASIDVYHTDMHAFDMLEPDTELAKEAITQFEKQFEYALANLSKKMIKEE